jgi:hypothetical protein
MSTRSAIAPRTSAAADMARLAVPLLVIAAAIFATIWIDRDGFAPAERAAGESPAAQVSAR